MAYQFRQTNTQTQGGTSRARESVEIVALRDCRTGRCYEVAPEKEQLTLGSDHSCDIVLTDPYASKQHCVLQRVGAKRQWHLRDHSKNGTRLNGTRVRVAELKAGGQLAIGDTCLDVVTRDELEATARGKLVGRNPGFLRQIDEALRAARSSCPVLILGETGTGKELVASAIHEASRRAESPFVPVNCGGIPRELIRSELFGHVKGAFTGATEDNDGLFRLAHGGTIFLDELGELPMDQQVHLLRALDSGLIRKVGGRFEEIVNTRVVAATNVLNLDSKRSPLRFDLYQRLSAVIIHLPPLRERPEDIPLLVRTFLDQAESEHGPRLISPVVLSKLSEHEWRGNVRELRNSVTRALALGAYQVTLEDFLPEGVVSPRHIRHTTHRRRPLSALEEAQRAMIEEAYARFGTIRAAAKALGMPKSTLADMCKRYGIKTARRRALVRRRGPSS